MQYNPKSEFDKKKAQMYFDKLMAGTTPFEVKSLKRRSNSQNSILHVWLSYLALELGCEMGYVKLQIFKMKWNRKMFYVKKVSAKTGEVYEYVRSSADLTKEEMTKALGVLIEKAALECGVIFPERGSSTFEDDFLAIQNEVYKNDKYL